MTTQGKHKQFEPRKWIFLQFCFEKKEEEEMLLFMEHSSVLA